MSGAAHVSPYRMRPGPGWNRGGWCGRSSDAVVSIVSGWEPGAELSEASCKQSDSEESDGAIETLVGVISPGCSFGEHKPEGSLARQAGLSGEVLTKSVTQTSDSRNSSRPPNDVLQTSQSVSLVNWGTAPMCGQTLPHKRRPLLRRTRVC